MHFFANYFSFGLYTYITEYNWGQFAAACSVRILLPAQIPGCSAATGPPAFLARARHTFPVAGIIIVDGGPIRAPPGRRPCADSRAFPASLPGALQKSWRARELGCSAGATTTTTTFTTTTPTTTPTTTLRRHDRPPLHAHDSVCFAPSLTGFCSCTSHTHILTPAPSSYCLLPLFPSGTVLLTT